MYKLHFGNYTMVCEEPLFHDIDSYDRFHGYYTVFASFL